MKKLKKVLSQLQVLVMPHAIITYVAIIVAVVLIILSGVFYADNPFASSVLMGIATGVISGIVLLIVTGIKNTWVYMLEEKVKWLDAVHAEILSYMGKEKAYLRFRQENILEDCYNYVYDFGADASNINAKISQAQFSKILPFNPDKYFLKKFDYDTYKMAKAIQELYETISNSDESEEFLSPKNIYDLFKDLSYKMFVLNHDILKDIEDKKRLLMLARKSILLNFQ